MTSDKNCFVIAPLGEPESETRKRSDQVLKHVIKPAVSNAGYNAVRADEIDKPGIITSQVIQHIVNDDLVIADLTERNPNVFYELAIRHAIAKPFVQLMRKGEQIPFDVAATRTIFVDHQDLDSVAEAKDQIVDQIRELERDPSDIETPISVSLDLQLLRQSEKPEDRSLADLVAAVSDIRGDIGRIDNRLDTIGGEEGLEALRHSIRRLPHRLADRFGTSSMPLVGRSRRFDPGPLEEFFEVSGYVSPGVEILVVASIFRDMLPWAHELSLEAFRLFRKGDVKNAMKRTEELHELLMHSSRSRWMHEHIETSDRNLPHLLDYSIHCLGQFMSKYARSSGKDESNVVFPTSQSKAEL